jgi:hypothetical protein
MCQNVFPEGLSKDMRNKTNSDADSETYQETGRVDVCLLLWKGNIYFQCNFVLINHVRLWFSIQN